MSHSEFKPPRRTPSQRGHLERLTGDYGRAHGIAHERARRWLSLVSFAGALDTVRADDGARFLIKGGASMELRLGFGARTTKDIDVVFRGAPGEMLDALEEAFAQPYGSFSFRRKGPVEDIRETGSRLRTVGRDLETARRAREELVTALAAGRVPASPRLRFDTVAGWWLARFEAKVAAGERHPRTLEAHRYHLDHNLLPRLASRRIATLGVEDVAALITELRADRRSAKSTAKPRWPRAGLSRRFRGIEV